MKGITQKVVAVSSITALFLFAPAATFAQAASQTLQVLPPKGTDCPVLQVQSVMAYTVNGSLHSFDVTLPDSTYIALLAQVGTQAIPFQYMTRFEGNGGVVRHHVDMDVTPIRGSIPVSLTLLSSPVGAPTCLSVVSFSVSPTGVILASGTATTPTSPTPTYSTNTPSKPAATKPPVTPVEPSATSSNATPGVVAPITKTVGERLYALCAGNGAFQFWFLLLAIYIVIAALTAFAKPPLALQSPYLPVLLILVPLVLLLAFWYTTPACRGALWMPVASIITAIVALLISFHEEEGVKIVVSLPAASKNTNPTTPAIKTSTSPLVTKQTVPLVQTPDKTGQQGQK